MRPSKQPDNRSSRVVPLPTCLADIHPPYHSKNEEICSAKSSWGVNCYAKSQVIGALCNKVFSLRLWLLVSFVAAFGLYCLNHRKTN